MYVVYCSGVESRYSKSYNNTTKGSTKLRIFLRMNTSLIQLRLLCQLDDDELHDIIHSLKDNHTLERLELPHEFHSMCSSMSIEEPQIVYV